MRGAPVAGKKKLTVVLDHWLENPELQRQSPLLRLWREALEWPLVSASRSVSVLENPPVSEWEWLSALG